MKIRAENIEFAYDENSPLLKNANFEIRSGDFVSVIGLNGSGKSTLLKLLARELKPLQGEIVLGEKRINEFTPKELAKTIAFVRQNYFPAFPISVYDFVATGRTPFLNFYGILKEHDKKVISENLRLLEIENLADKLVTEISGGEFRRATIARALSQESEILLLDEPSAFLDVEHQISIFKFLKRLNAERGITIITVSHDLNLVGMFSNGVILLEKGSVLQSGKDGILNAAQIKKHFGVNSLITNEKEKIYVTILD